MVSKTAFDGMEIRSVSKFAMYVACNLIENGKTERLIPLSLESGKKGDSERPKRYYFR